MTNNNEDVRVLHGQEETALNRQAETERVLTAQQEVAGTGVRPITAQTPAADGEVGRLQLLEERAVVEVQRQGVGQVQIRKVVHERQEMVPVTITSEVLEITVQAASAAAQAEVQGVQGAASAAGVSEILIDGQPLQVGQTYTIPLSEERYQVVKQVYPISDVVVRKRVKTETHQESVTLRHEELDVKADEGLTQNMDAPGVSRR